MMQTGMQMMQFNDLDRSSTLTFGSTLAYGMGTPKTKDNYIQ